MYASACIYLSMPPSFLENRGLLAQYPAGSIDIKIWTVSGMIKLIMVSLDVRLRVADST